MRPADIPMRACRLVANIAILPRFTPYWPRAPRWPNSEARLSGAALAPPNSPQAAADSSITLPGPFRAM